MGHKPCVDNLFGGDKPWSSHDWTSSDDRVRGGSSHSELVCRSSSPTAIFQGNLDIKTLGGAGFASQRTTGEDRVWDLSSYDGMLLDIDQADDKKYTLILKDELLPKSPNGREQSTVSWEYDFRAKRDGDKVAVRWDDFVATYRGKERPDAKPLDLKEIKRVSVMMRSFFGTQEGDFSLSIRSISVVKHPSSGGGGVESYRDDPNEVAADFGNEKPRFAQDKPQQSWWSWLAGSCVVS